MASTIPAAVTRRWATPALSSSRGASPTKPLSINPEQVHTTTVENGLVLNRYWLSHCRSCAFKPGCTTGNERRVTRWEHEHVVEAMQDRLDRRPDALRIRRRTIEHVFGTIKDWMGRSHFKMQRLANVGTEMSLHVLAYNMKRAIALLGAPELIAAMRG